jgi:hypothetical protein
VSGIPVGTAAAADLVYAYRPSLLGAPWEFRLAGTALEWTAGTKSGRVSYQAMRRLRLSYKPATMQSYRFLTEIWADGAPKLAIASTSWRSMVEQERLDRSYVAFILELHKRIDAAEGAMPVRYERGANPFIFWPGAAVAAGLALALLILVVRAVETHAVEGALFIAAFGALFLWQGVNFFRRNRPGTYRPGALPRDLMPKGRQV